MSTTATPFCKKHPNTPLEGGPVVFTCPQCSMELQPKLFRDEVALVTLQCLLRNENYINGTEGDANKVANDCYAIADAFVRRRAK